MNQDEAFLHAIRENPGDDGPRLVYADWLDEHGQPERAEFIRVQCQLAPLEPDDDRYPALKHREFKLWGHHHRAWSEPLRPFTRSYSFHRGFADHVSLSAETF